MDIGVPSVQWMPCRSHVLVPYGHLGLQYTRLQLVCLRAVDRSGLACSLGLPKQLLVACMPDGFLLLGAIVRKES